ncbi:ABC transporter G family member 39 [Euphorbia peplus]|nr:ABC transporter G family member 39 [Euphorbia peplus]
MEGSERVGSARFNSSSIWRNNSSEMFPRNSSRRDQEDDEESLMWAALERLPTYNRLRKGIFSDEEIDIKKLDFVQKKNLLDKFLNVAEEDNEKFLLKLKDRLERVGLQMPRIEVQFENLNIEAEAYIGGRAFPSVLNFTLNVFEGFLNYLHILPSRKKPLPILHDICGIIRPQRMTLLLGPPSSGKTTLLLALAGKLDKSLKVSGKVTYNGQEMREFVPQRSSAYVSQYDLHIGEMTVRETLAFSARCQGVGPRYEILAELSRREKAANIKPDPDIDLLMKAVSLKGQETNVMTDYIIKILGLEVCADTVVGDELTRGISGGQRKRVTTGEMLVGPARALFMDEISTGLDSSTTKGVADFLQEVTSKKDQEHLAWVDIQSTMGSSCCPIHAVLAKGGFDPSFTRLLKQYLVLLCTSQMASGLFRLVAVAGRNIIVANTFGSFALLIVVVMGGFVISRDDVKPWWKWGYWASPMMYAQNAISVNEFLGDSWSHAIPNSTEKLGTAFLKYRGIFPEARWFWIGVGALVGYVFVFNFLYTLALKYLDPLGKHQAVLPKENSNEKQSSSSELEYRDELQGAFKEKKRQEMVLPFEPLSITFNEIRYSVDMPQEMKAQGIPDDRLELLKGVSGTFRPGVLTALMGVSGAGKTTLMDVLAGRKTAWLRLAPEVDYDTKKLLVEQVMELVELDTLREAIVGLPGVNGLSVEQRKRLTIAVELVANPSIIFMDEPTSGLDARAAAIVMRTVRNTVDTGRTVVCTIHQPSIDIFDAFDELFLLKRGGEEIYVGPVGRHACHLIKYFEAIKGVLKIKDGYNPATWMLEVTSMAQEDALGVDFCDIYKNSELYRRNKALINELSSPPLGSKDLYFPTQYSQSFLSQCTACLWKQHWSYWRNPSYTAVRLLFTTFIALMFGTMFWNIGTKRAKMTDLLNAMGSIYSAVIFLGVQNASSVQPVVAIERTVFYRERAAGMYSALPYAVAQVVIELPYIFVQAIVYGAIVYAMIVAVTPNHHIAAVVAVAFYALWNVFSGFIIPRSRIPVWWRWYYWICPVSWTLYGMIVSQFGDVNEPLDLGGSVKDFVSSYFGFDHDFLGVVAAAHVGFCVLFYFIFAFSIKAFNFQTR